MSGEYAAPPEPGPYLSALAVGAGGALGANARYLIGLAVTERWSTDFPWGTLLVNVTGCLAIGLVTGRLLARGDRPLARLFVATGVLGGYTTVSAFAYEAVRLIDDGRLLTALAYIAASLVLCLGGAALGLRIGERR